MSFVLDCSVAITWCFDEETSAHSDALLQRLINDGAVVPALWVWEISNVLSGAAKRKRFSKEQVLALAQKLKKLPIKIDPESIEAATQASLQLATDKGLTSYVAAYLELALRLQLPLATLDKDLAKAAKATRVVVL